LHQAICIGFFRSFALDMPRLTTYFFALLFVFMGGCTAVKPTGKQNLAHQYNSDFPFEVSSRILDAGEDYNLFLEINFKKLTGIQEAAKIWDRYKISYHVSAGYESRKIIRKDTLGADQRLLPSVNPLVLFLKIPKTFKNQLVTFSIKENNGHESFLYDVPVREAEAPGNYEVCLFMRNGRLPIFRNYIQTGDTVVVRKISFLNEELDFEFHPFNSSVALPPMAAIPTSGHDFDKAYPVKVVPNQRMVFKEPGYYFLPSPKGAKQGFGFMVMPPYFPMVSTPLELIDPMIYISTREERKNLLEASNQKLALDQFWLKANGQKNAARKLIKDYFVNVETANRLFSSHKDGWKTDQGMVAAIYGLPPVVYRSWDLEIWQYEKTANTENTIFYFSRRPYDKDPNVWEMKRFNEYDRIWYGVVELWRKGVINR